MRGCNCCELLMRAATNRMQMRRHCATGFLLFSFALSLVQHACGAGVTIITHGFEWVEGFPDWIGGMGEAVAERVPRRSSSDNVTWVHLTVYKDANQVISFDSVVDEPAISYNGEVIVLIDWSDLAGLDVIGDFVVDTQELAAFLAPYLRTAPWLPGGKPLAELPIHLIGHSRGASLVSELARLLGQNGIWVDQVTTLDPHPVCYLAWVDAPVTNYSNVLFADNYWQNFGTSSCGAIVNAGIPSGFAVYGATNRFLTVLGSGGCSGLNYRHSNVHLWYHGTVDLGTPSFDGACTITSAERSTWWLPSESQGANTGFKFSRLNGGTMAGTQNTRPNTGLKQAGASRVPVTVTATGSSAWDNIAIVDFVDDRQVQQGGTSSVHIYWEDNKSLDGTIQIGLDTDSNPYNGVSGAPLVTQAPSTSNGDAQKSLSTSGVSPGTYYVYAKISNGTHTRYYYAHGRLVVVANPDAVTVALTSVADTFVYEYYPTANYGSWTTMGVVGWPFGYRMLSYFKFNLSSIPADVAVQSAELKLYSTRTYNPAPVASHVLYLMQSWSESTVTWNTKPQEGAGFNLAKAFTSAGTHTWSSSEFPALSTKVQTWVNNPSQNYAV